MEYYTYAYLREDRTPYYIGKGKKSRLTENKRHNVKVPIRSRIIFLKQNLTEEEAFRHEIYMIDVLGRKDLGTGILRNKTDGGEGMSGYKHSEDAKKKISLSNKGRKWCDDDKKRLSENLKGRKGPIISEDAKKRLSDNRKGIKRPQYVIDKVIETKKNKYKPENHISAKKFTFISPTGEEYLVVGGFKRFCDENNISNWGMRNILKTGKIVPGCKNWMVKKND
jgi:hypothetical protein